MKLRLKEFIWLFCIGLISTITTTAEGRHGHRRNNNGDIQYLVALPKVLMGGSTEVICLSLFDMDGPMYIKLQLLQGETIVMENAEYFMEFPYACLALEIPNVESPGRFTFKILGRKDEQNNSTEYTLQDSSPIKIDLYNVETFIETDKVVYKPGQTVKFRILSLDQNLRPDLLLVDKVWIESPSGVHIAQWFSITGEKGLISLELPMTSDPMMGEWNIHVEHRSIRTEQTFTVKEYVLPKFEVSIDGPSYLMMNETSITYKVCGRYTYGQPVQGSLSAILSCQFSYTRDPRTPITIDIEDTGPDGCVDVDFDIASFNLMTNTYSTHDAKLTLSVDFTELVTGIMLHEENEDCKLEKILYQLTFVSNTHYKMGLPFIGKIHLTNPNGSPVAGEVVLVRLMTGGVFSEELITDANGDASFSTSIYENESSVRFTATIPGLQSTGPWSSTQFRILGPEASLRVQPTFSPSETFLQISPIDESHSVGSQMTVRVFYTGQSNRGKRNFKLLFMSRGNIIRPTYTSQHQPELGAEDYRCIEFHFQVTQDMTPLTKLVVYFVRNDEVVADTMEFKVDMVFLNDVDISFSEDELKPGDATSLDISASPNSLCGVGIVDKSAYLLAGGNNNIQAYKVVDYLTDNQLGADSGIQSQRCDSRGRNFGYRELSRDSSHAFNDAGFTYLTNLQLETAECPPIYEYRPVPMMFMMAGGMRGPGGRGRFIPTADDTPLSIPKMDARSDSEETTQEPPRVRSYFPETWLWDTFHVESNGQARVDLTVPDTVTEWVGSGFCISENEGIGISDTSRLQAFQPFFLSYTLPYSVIRAENFPVKVTVFNYLQECLVLELTLSDSDNFSLADGEDRIKSICVCGSQSAAVDFNIIPSMIGSMPIEVTAVTTSDGFGICGNELVTTLKVADAIRKEILVEAEGIPQEVTKSEFFCPSDFEDGFNLEMDIQAPDNIVADTASAKIKFSGDVMGPTLSNLENLLQMPYGCGEQNMLTFVPNILAMQYLTATEQLTPEVEREATDNMKLGYQREFNYRHDDGSFSAFGKSDDSGSTWLTAYVVRSFYQASPFIDVDFDNLQRSVDWLKGLQQDNGCFISVGRLCHKDMLGGINSDLTLSAYILISLLEARIPKEDAVIVKGLECIESEINVTEDTYALTQMAYALALAESARTADVIQKLEDVALYEGGKHWISNRESPDTTASYHRPSSADVEMTAYVLLTYMQAYSRAQAMVGGLSVLRWLVQRRNSNGGFGSTQDTVVGLTALAKFSEFTASGDMNITLDISSSLAQPEWGNTMQYQATNQNRLLLRQLYLENLPTSLSFQGMGSGCGLLQVSLFYNTYPEEDEEPQFNLVLNITEEIRQPFCTYYQVLACASYSGGDGASNMAVMDFRLQSGFKADEDSLHDLKDNFPLLKRYDLDGKSVLFYFEEITSKDVCVRFNAFRDIEVKDAKPAFLTVYDYYKTDVKKILAYSFGCQPEIGILPGQLNVRLSPCAAQLERAMEGDLLGSFRPRCEVNGDYSVLQRHSGFGWCVDSEGNEIPGTKMRSWDRVDCEDVSEQACPLKIGSCLSSQGDVDCEVVDTESCIQDIDCHGERKCCRDGCFNICVYPQFPVPQPDGLPSSAVDPTEDDLSDCEYNKCPICEDTLPDDWEQKFCHSYYAALVKVTTSSTVKLIKNYRYEDESFQKTSLTFTTDNECECELVVDGRYMIMTDYSSIDMDGMQYTVDEKSLIIPFRARYRTMFNNYNGCQID